MDFRMGSGRFSKVGAARLLAFGLLTPAILMLSGCGQKPPAPTAEKQIEIHRYGISSGTVDYDVSGIKVGHERLYFDHWGTREARYIHVTSQMLGMSQEEDTLKIADGPWNYTINLHKATGSRMPNPLLQTYAKKIGPDGKLILGDELMLDMGAHKGGSRTILGRTCQIWLVPEKHVEYCLWKNLMLLTRVENGDAALVTRAVAIAENVPLKNDVFNIPASVVIVEPAPPPPPAPQPPAPPK